jgi:histone H4
MTSRGKGVKGLGKGGAKKHCKILRDNIQWVTDPAIRRLARRGGVKNASNLAAAGEETVGKCVKRVSGLVYEETRGILKGFLEDLLRDSVTYMEHPKKKTVTEGAVVQASKKNKRILYGFSEED